MDKQQPTAASKEFQRKLHYLTVCKAKQRKRKPPGEKLPLAQKCLAPALHFINTLGEI